MRERRVRALIRTIEHISRACGHVAAVLVLVLMLLMVYEVVLRYVFDAPTLWGFDVTTMTMGAIFVLSIGYTLAADSHVRVDLLQPKFGPHGKAVIDAVGFGLILLPLLIWLTWGLWEHFRDAFASQERTGTSAWNPRVWPFRAVMFVGALTWTLQALAETVRAVLRLRGGPLADIGRSATE